MKTKNEDKPLTAEVKNKVLNISIGIDQLCHACSIGRRYGLGDIEITDKKLFVEGIVQQLKSQDHDGSTVVHAMLDNAVNEMLENGELGLDELET
jgi:hypothetical protein